MRSQIGTARVEPAAKIDVETNMVVYICEFISVPPSQFFRLLSDCTCDQIRDKHAAAALGRPCRIRDEDCDIEPPTEDDLLFDADTDSPLVPVQSRHHVAYFLEITKLSNIRE